MRERVKKAKFRVGQVVAIQRDGGIMGYMKIGFIERITHDDGRPDSFWYTADITNEPPYYTEGVLRPLTAKERGA